MVQILLLDRDPFFCSQVCSRMNSISGNLHFFDRTDYGRSLDAKPASAGSPSAEQFCQDAVDLSTLPVSWDTTLVIYHPQQFYNPPPGAFTLVLTENLPEDRLLSGRVYKYGNLTMLHKTIEEYLSDHPDFVPNKRKETICCVVGGACPPLRLQYMQNLTREKMSKGVKVLRIDLCAPCFSDCPGSISQGYSLSDAFLKIMAEDLSYKDIGLFLCSMPDGAFRFRPVERADDLFECTPDDFRKFTDLVVQWVTYSGEPFYVLINCYGIPFSSIYAISVLCDRLLILNREDAPNSAASYNRELGYLLSNLPGSCKVQEDLLSCNQKV